MAGGGGLLALEDLVDASVEPNEEVDRLIQNIPSRLSALGCLLHWFMIVMKKAEKILGKKLERKKFSILCNSEGLLPLLYIIAIFYCKRSC
ncbi:hypothetical protein [Paenibacillus lactis]|uniref:hypothetical protein n=1 Tax=Paenibacillus lactis TaxID=228574 RepID=UPI0011A0EFBB